MAKVTLAAMEALLLQYRGRYTTVVGFQPTGWTAAERHTKGLRAGGRRMQRGTAVLYQVKT
jgi:DNA cross-link repair 1A protein